MNQSAIFWPMTVQVLLTLVVAVRMYHTRVAELYSRRISPQELATSRSALAASLQNVAAADNFRNLFEFPVLFFAICPILYITNGVTPLQLILAWAFVFLRIAHSFVHITYNRVIHRFRIFVLGMLSVSSMWAVFAIHLWRDL